MSITTFSDLGISESICTAIQEMGFEAPTKIQEAAIPAIMKGGDVAGQAQTGTGKTAAFSIPLLERVDIGLNQTQGLVLCPTRELAVQITGEILKLGSHCKGLHVTPVYGGQPIGRQISQLKRGSHIVVGTPGRLIDHLKRGTLNLENLRMVVLDEVDEMLNMGFRDDIEQILGFAGEGNTRQTVMFSATLSAAIKKLMKRWFENPELIQVESQVSGASGIEQYLVEVRDSMRTEGICRILDLNQYKRSLVFCNTKRTCDSLVDDMQSRGYSSGVLHGDMNQNMRDKVMAEFRNGRIDLLIATDVAARGLDVENVDVVFNYDIPHDPEYYVHRIGRTGRAGRDGTAYTFSAGRKNKNIRFIEKQLKMNLKSIPLPSVKEVKSSLREAFQEEVSKTLETGGLRPFIEQVEAIASDRFSPMEVAAALLKMREESRPEEKEKESGSAPKQKRSARKQRSKPTKKDPFYTPFVKKGKGRSRKRR